MQNCKGGDASVVKDDKFNLSQYPKNDLEKESMNTIPFSIAMGVLCMRRFALS